MNKADEKGAAAKSPAGLEGVVAAESSIGDVDGINGVLIYQGLNIHDLAEHATFEEVVYLLWHGHLPKRDELESLRRELSDNQQLPDEVVALIRRFPPDAEPMDSLRTAVSALAFYDAGARDLSREGALRTATKLTAQFPVVVAAIERIRNGKEPVAPKPELGIAANFLYMLNGETPVEREAHIMDVCLVLHADHELNASTFTARVVAAARSRTSTRAVTAAIGALSRAAPRRREHERDEDAARNRQPRPGGGVGERRARAKKEGDGLRPSRLQDGRPARGVAPQVLERDGRSAAARRAGPRYSNACAKSCSATRSSTRTWTTTPARPTT